MKFEYRHEARDFVEKLERLIESKVNRMKEDSTVEDTIILEQSKNEIIDYLLDD